MIASRTSTHIHNLDIVSFEHPVQQDAAMTTTSSSLLNSPSTAMVVECPQSTAIRRFPVEEPAKVGFPFLAV
jgi:hypothetical protein